jgi:hypothetical protein
MQAAMRLRIICAASAAALVVVAGCGGGDSSSTTTASDEELTKAELVDQGDAICKNALGEFAQLQQNPPTTAEGAATLTQKVVDVTETELDQLRDLNAPASVQSDLGRYLKALEKNVATLKQGLKAAQQNDATGYARAQAKTVEDQVARLKLAQAVGFQECSRPAGTAPGSTG